MNSRRDPFTGSNEAAWDIVARKYAPDVESDIEFLQNGGISLTPTERRLLGDLSGCDAAIHLQCSHGLDALSLLNMGVAEVVGVDISRAMLSQAKVKSDRLGARARWVHSDVLDPPEELFESADLLYTGKGALCWIRDIYRWGKVARQLVRPHGTLFVHEAHPLNWVWAENAETHVARPGRRYFDRAPMGHDGFPGEAVRRLADEGVSPPTAWE